MLLISLEAVRVNLPFDRYGEECLPSNGRGSLQTSSRSQAPSSRKILPDFEQIEPFDLKPNDRRRIAKDKQGKHL
jgi:hypothetical protein